MIQASDPNVVTAASVVELVTEPVGPAVRPFNGGAVPLDLHHHRNSA